MTCVRLTTVLAVAASVLGYTVAPGLAADEQMRQHVRQQLVQIQVSPEVVDTVSDQQLNQMNLVLSTRDPASEKRAWIGRIVASETM
jgi:hypothetical protein